ncbi:MAG: hypothetical protein ACP5D2_04775 [Candidatus Nanoarchaeia archaeon]
MKQKLNLSINTKLSEKIGIEVSRSFFGRENNIIKFIVYKNGR